MGEKRKAQSQHSVRPSFLPSPCSPKQVQFRSLKSTAQLRQTHFMMCLSPACVLPLIQVQYTYLSDLPETLLKPRVDTNSSLSHRELCCWIPSSLIATFYTPSDLQFLPLKKVPRDNVLYAICQRCGLEDKEQGLVEEQGRSSTSFSFVLFLYPRS